MNQLIVFDNRYAHDPLNNIAFPVALSLLTICGHHCHDWLQLTIVAQL
jgi:hypothetical protein